MLVPPTRYPGRIEFVILISVIMMIVAFTIDSMLPALPAIGSSLGVGDEARWPFVISAFLAGFGVSQLFVGVLSDRYGRRTLILWSLFGFALTSLAATLAPTFEHLLVARIAQGATCAGARVIVTSIVRDRFEGREMAQVMSLASMVFMAAPILAPAMGQLVLTVGPWRWIFGALALIGLAIWTWVLFRLPETLAPENQTAISFPTISASARTVVTDRMSLGYGCAMAVVSCALFGFLMSVQPIFQHTFNRPEFLPAGFAMMAGGMAVASLLNAVIVKKYGMRRIGHAALFFFTGVAGIHVVVAMSGHESLWSFIGLQMAMMMGFSLMAGNFGAMAMENMGKVAGMASSLQGSLANIVASVFGTAIGRAFDGTTVPLYAGYFFCGLIALVIVFVTERGKFFVAHHAPRAKAGD
ncbi:MAG: multidrug effflux MFS transporter [Sphingomonadaceae bacterium]|nr:multidrug effflux MFS transporter [Sphingomonadaceae bacterium]